MSLRHALVLKKWMGARGQFEYSVWRSGVRSPGVSPFYVKRGPKVVQCMY